MFALLHGQADVERRFNMNKQALVDNLQQFSLVSQKLIHDTLLAQEVKPHTSEVTNILDVTWKQAHSRYVAAAENEKSEVFATSKDNKCKHLQLELSEAQPKKSVLRIASHSLMPILKNCILELKKNKTAHFLSLNQIH